MPAATTPHLTKRRPRKSLGQHYLTDPRIANRIVAAAELIQTDLVVEIGPGNGVLTRRLVERAGQVVAVELDERLAAELPDRLDHPGNLEVRCEDARLLDIDRLAGPDTGYKLVANLPYYAASPIVRRFLEADRPPDLMVVMVQREVGEAMTAKPGDMTLLSVATQFYADASVVTHVPGRAFRPPPRVSSTVVKLRVHENPVATVANIAEFFDLARAGFSAPRKQLRNSLMQGTGASPDTVTHVLDDAGIDGQRRPATLSIEEWARLDGVWPNVAPRKKVPR